MHFQLKPRSKKPKKRFLAETLEDRILYSAVPQVTVQAPAQAQLGENVQVTVSFKNASATDTGYGPFVLVAIDHTGADGVAPGTPAPTNTYDGFTLAGTPTYLGAALNYQVLTLDDTANGGLGVINPYAKDNAGNPVYMKTTDTFFNGQYQNGDQVLAIQLPFGSYTPSQPQADIKFSLALSNLADVGATLPLRVVGGFQFGNDALDNPTAPDPTIIGVATGASTTVDASLAQISMTYNGPENETATGINYLRTYRVNVNIANGQTLSGLNVFAGLDSNAQFYDISGASAAYTVIGTPSTTTPGGTVQIQFDNPVAGTASATDAWVDVRFYVPRVDGASASVLNPSTGAPVTLDAQAYGYGNWTPVDSRDPVTRVGLNATVDPNTANPANPVPTVAPEHNDLEAQSIVVQKSFTNITQGGSDAGGIKPGDTLEFTLNFQISDYYAFQNINLSDLLSDGLHIDSTFTPTLQINGNTFVLATTAFATGNYTVSQNFTGATAAGNFVIDPAANDGTTGILFAISNQMITEGRPDGMLLGGGVDPNAPTPAIANNLTGYNDGPTTGTIKYRVVVQDAFTDNYPSGNASLNPRDVLTNGADITGDVLALAPGFAATGSTATDDTAISLKVKTDQVQKTIYAVNGNTDLSSYIDLNGNVNLKPGDVVTYRLVYTLPTGDVEQLRFTDYLPLPIFNANEITGFDNTTVGIPVAGRAQFGPTYNLNTATTPPGAITVGTPGNAGTPSTSNAVKFTVGTTDNTTNDVKTVDILFSVTVINQPFADGLYLTNLVQSGEQNTQNPGVAFEATTNAIVQIVLNEPQVSIYKGVVASTQGGAVPATGGLTFADVSSSGFTGVLSGQANAQAIGALNLTTGTLPDAGDLVRFAIIAQNIGRSDAYEVAFKDAISNSYVNSYADATALQSGTNMKVYRGDGTLLTAGVDYTVTWNTSTKEFSIQLTDNYTSGNQSGDTGNGGLSRGTKAADNSAIANGSNAVIVLFDLTVATAAQANSVVTNTATLTKYTNEAAAPNFVPLGLTDTAIVDLKTPQVSKVLTGTSLTNTNNSNTQAVIGEYVTYTITITVPEGTTAGASLVDNLAPGMSFVDIQSVTYSSGVSSANTIGTGATPAFVTVGNVNFGTSNKLTFNFGNITNTNVANATADTITIVYRAIVLDNNQIPASPGNQAGSVLGNTAAFSYAWTNDPNTPTPGSTATVNSTAADVTVVEPTLTVDNEVSSDNATYGASLVNQQAGSTIYYRLTIKNTTAGSTTAYDLELIDALPMASAGHSFINNVSIASVSGVAGVTAANFTLSGSNTLGWTLTANSGEVDLASGSTLSIVLQGTISVSAETGKQYDNTATIRWSSLDGNATNLSTYNAASAKERTGGVLVPGQNTNLAQTDQLTLDNYAATSSNATSTELTPTPTKTIDATSETSTSGSKVAVGEIVRYRIVWQIPQGTSTNVVITDNLPNGMQYLNDGTTTLAIVSSGGDINSSIGSIGTLASVVGDENTIASINPSFVLPGAQITGGAFGDGTNPVFNLGTLVNTDNDSVNATTNNEYVVIEFNAIVLNVTGNQAVDNQTGVNSTQTSPSNTATVATSTSSKTSSGVAVQVVEPAITDVTKTVVSTGPYVAGSTVIYQVTFSNSSATNATTAFDVVLTDVLPAFLTNVSIVGGYPTSTGTVSGLGAGSVAGNTVTLNVSSMAPGATVTFRFQGDLVSSVPASQIVTNTASVTYTSLPGSGTALDDGVAGTTNSTAGTAGTTTGERTGSGGAGADGTIANNYSDSSTVSVTVGTPTVDKQFQGGGAATADDTSVASSSGSSVVVGEAVTYDILVTLPPGVTKGLVINDIIPPGMRLDMTFNGNAGYQIVTSAGGLLTNAYSGSSLSATLTGVGGTLGNDGVDAKLTFTGDVTLPIDSATNNTNKFVVRVRAIVDNVLTNQTGVTLTNTATLAYTNPNDSTTLTVNDATPNDHNVTVVEPTLTLLKSVTESAGDSGDTLHYSISLSNSSGQTAYNVIIEDVIDPLLSNATITGVTATGLALTTADFEVVQVTAGNLSEFRESTAVVGRYVLRLKTTTTLDMADATSFVITMTAKVGDAAITGQSLPNKFAAYWTSTSGTNADERSGADNPNPSANTPQNDATVLNNYSISSSVVSTAVAPIVVSQEILSTSTANTTGTNVAVGEYITYRITVTLPEGTTQNLVIDVNLPGGVAYVPGSVALIDTHPDPTSLNDFQYGTTTGEQFGQGTSGLTAPSVANIAGSGNFQNGNGVRFIFSGPITNTGDNNTNNNAFYFTYQALVLDVAGNTSGHTLTPTATWVAGQVVAATTANLAGAIYNPTGGTNGTGKFTSGAPTVVDGVTLAVGNLVLVKNQTDAKQNGVYVVLSSGVWERWVNYDQGNEITPGSHVEVTGGTVNIGRTYAKDAGVIAVNTDPITFSLTASNTVFVDDNTGGTNPLANGVTATVVVPSLNITKTVVVNGSGTSGDAGDPAVYTITVQHAAGSTSSAYDVNLSDAIPAQLTGLSITSAVITDGVTSTDVTALLQLTGNTLSTVNTGTALDLLMNAGGVGVHQRLVVTIGGNLISTLNPGFTNGVQNTATVTYTTLQSNSLTQQTNLINDSTPAPGGVNDGTDRERLLSANASATLTAPTTIALAKTLQSSSDSNTTGSNLTIGETGLFRLTATLEEGVTKLVTFKDTLQSGLDFVSGTSPVFRALTAGSTVTGVNSGQVYTDGMAILATDLSFNSGTGLLQFFFKDATIPSTATPGSGQFAIDYTVVVKNVVGNIGFSGSQTTLSNSAFMMADRNGDGDNTDPGETSATQVQTITVVEPKMTIDKSFDKATADAGDVITVTFTLTNTGTSIAWDTVIADTISSSFFDLSSVTAGTTPAGWTYSYNSGTGALSYSANAGTGVAAGGGTATFTFTAKLKNALNPGITVSNTATVTHATTLSGVVTGERDEPSVNDSATLTVPTTITLGKTLQSTSDANTTAANVTIGETAVFRLTATLQEGLTKLVTFKDTLPTGLNFVSGTSPVFRAVTAGSTVTGVNSGQVYTDGMAILAADLSFNGGTGLLQFFFKDVTIPATTSASTGSFAIDYTVVVKDVAANIGFGGPQTTLTNSAFMMVDLNGDGDNVDPGETSATKTQTLTVVEPHLTLTKTTTTPGSDAGDAVVYTLTITNATGANISNAYDINVTDLLDADIALIDNQTGVGHGIVVTGATVTANTSTTGQLNITLDSLAPGSSITIVLNAKVVASAQAGSTVTNSASLTYTSLSGSVTGERTGANGSGGSPDNYATSATSSNFLLATPTIDKLTPAITNYAIGQIVTYDILITVPEGNTPALVITDLLPTGLVYTGFSVVTTAAGSGGLLAADFNGTVTGSPTVTNPTGNNRAFDFGLVTAVGDNVTTNNTFILRVSARIDNVVGNQGLNSPGVATTFSNTATLKYTNGTSGTATVTDPTAPGAITVVEPIVTVTKGVDDTTPHLGQTLTYTITLSNTGTSTAFDTVFTDAMPGGILVTGITVTPSGGVHVDSAAASTGGGTGITGQYDIPAGGSVVVTYTATVSTDPAIVGGTFNNVGETKLNTVSVTYTSLDGGNTSSPDAGERSGSGGVNNYTATANQTVTVVGADLAVTKTDGGVSVSPGGSVTYTITITNNGTDTATNVIISDVLPLQTGVTFNAGASTAGFALVGSTISKNIGSLAVGATATVTVVLDVANPVAATLELLTDTASATHDDVEPTPANNTATDTTPVNARPDLVVTKVELLVPGIANAGDTLQYKITVTNVGNQNATGVVLIDNFDDYVLDYASSSAGGTFDGDKITWNLGNLTGGGGSTFVLVNANVKNPIPPGRITVVNSATATFVPNAVGEGDPTPANNTDTATVTLPGVPDMVVTKTNSVPTISYDTPFTYTITVTNIGQQTATGVEVTDTLPPLGVYLSSTGGGVYDPATRKITWNIAGNFLGNGVQTVTFQVTMVVPRGSTNGGTLTNLVSVKDDGLNGFDFDLNNNKASTTTQIFQFVYDGYQNFSTWSPFGESEDEWWQPGKVVNYHLPMLTVTPIYSGAVDPGSTLIVDIFNALGVKVGTQTVVADMGGNWMATFPNSVLYDYPQTVVITEQSSLMDNPEKAGFNLRTYFSPAINSSHFFYQKPDVNSVFRGTSEHVLSSMYQGALRPFNFDLNNFSYEFLTSQATPAGY